MRSGHVVVVSDLHVSAGALDDFDHELESHFVSFLEEDLARREYPIELVINGDFLDFVQAPPFSASDLQARSAENHPLCFTQSQSLTKLTAIYNAHRPTFCALTKFLAANPANRLVVLPGNHDPDFFWPSIRREFIKLVSNDDPELAKSINIHLDSAFRPHGCKGVWIEHGQQYDPVNSFFLAEQPCWSEDYPPILHDGDEDRLYACLGTRFLIDYLNDLDQVYPFVDNVKPFSRFVRLFLVSAVNPKLGPIKAAVAGWRILGYLSNLAIAHPKDLLGIDGIRTKDETDLLSRIGQLARHDKTLFEKINHKYPSDLDLRLILKIPAEQDRFLAWLSDNLYLLEEIPAKAQENLLSLSSEDDNYLSLSKSFRLDETALLTAAAVRILLEDREESIKLVIMGHTHEPVNKPDSLAYFNTGSWTRCYRFDETNQSSSWSILKEQSYTSFPYLLNYVDIDIDNPSTAQMICYKSRDYD